ncbi:MAG: sugar kinase [Myxococcales bacterium]|nr:sugar kinase [Myxococcales bacterium]
MRPTALVVGHVTLDAAPTGFVPGGSVWYGARTLRALGARPWALTAAGPDFPPLGPGWRCGAATSTTRFANSYDAEGGRVQILLSLAEPIEVQALPPQWRTPALAFLAPVLGDFEPGPFVAALAGCPLVGAGLQGWLKHARPGGKVLHGPVGVDPERFRGLHVAFLSEEDLAGRLDWLDALCAVVPLVYLTRGRHGATMFGRDGARDIPACAAEEVDPTGAGDTFAAATLLALAQGKGPVEAARQGAAAASVVVEHRAAAPLKALRRSAERLERPREVA